MLNVMEMRWKIMGELKWSPKVMWNPKIKENMCSNKIEFLTLNEKVAYLKIRICEVNAHLRGFGRIFGGDFLWEIVPTWVTTHIQLSFYHKIRIWHIREEENDVHLLEFDFYTWHWSSIQQTRISLWDCHLMPLV